MNIFKSALAGSVLLLSLVPALAADANEAAARLKALMEAHGATVSWTSLAGSSDDAILHGVKMTLPGEDSEVQLGTVEMRGIDDGPDGAITVQTLIAPGYSHTRGADKFDVKGVEIDRLVMPDPGAGEAKAASFDTMHMKSIRFAKRDRELFSAEDVTHEMDASDGDGAITVTTTAQRFDAVADRYPVARDIGDILGIAKYAGSLRARGSWSPTDGDVELKSAEFQLDDSGRLTLSFAGSGYTRELIRSGQALNFKTGGEQSVEALMAQGMAMMGLVSQVTFDGAAMRFEPEPGVKPDPAAAKKARDRIARDLAPFGKAFADKSLAEIDEYIADPKSLEVRAAPAAPLGAATLMMALMMAPKGLPQQLGLAIKANE